jgi:ribosomal protein S18 acetylase RimI-like enzyme
VDDGVDDGVDPMDRDREDAVTLRPATSGDAPAVAAIWHTGWRDGHLGNVPDELVAARTEASFLQRAVERVPATTVAEVDGQVAGFVTVIDDEVEQVYVSADHRGRGVADALMEAAEQQLARDGHARAWLAVVAGNRRARRFYERRGWADGGLFDHQAPDGERPITVPAHRYVKDLEHRPST